MMLKHPEGRVASGVVRLPTQPVQALFNTVLTAWLDIDYMLVRFPYVVDEPR